MAACGISVSETSGSALREVYCEDGRLDGTGSGS